LQGEKGSPRKRGKRFVNTGQVAGERGQVTLKKIIRRLEKKENKDKGEPAKGGILNSVKKDRGGGSAFENRGASNPSKLNKRTSWWSEAEKRVFARGGKNKGFRW